MTTNSLELNNDIIKLKSGATIRLCKSGAFNHCNIKVVTDADGNKDRCGFCHNVNAMIESDDDDEIEAMEAKMHKSNIPCGLTSIMHHEIIDEKDLAMKLSSDISECCWGIFTTTNDRKEVVKMYHDARPKSIRAYQREYRQMRKDDVKKRDDLAKDPTDLIGDIYSGNTVVLVFGFEKCREIYYFKVKNLYMRIVTDHTMSLV
jgi:hypothetical protein